MLPGDLLGGSLFANLHQGESAPGICCSQSQTEVIDVLNALQLDYSVPLGRLGGNAHSTLRAVHLHMVAVLKLQKTFQALSFDLHVASKAFQAYFRLGNHEFDYGAERTKEFPAVNLTSTSTYN